VLRVLLLPGAIDHPRDLPVAAEEHAVTPPMTVLARIELRQIAVRVAALADVDGDREHGVRNRENRRSAPGSLAGEDEAGQVGAGRRGDCDVLLPSQAADLDERTPQQLAQLRGRVRRAHQRRADEDRVGAGQLRRSAVGAGGDPTFGDDQAVAGKM